MDRPPGHGHRAALKARPERSARRPLSRRSALAEAARRRTGWPITPSRRHRGQGCDGNPRAVLARCAASTGPGRGAVLDVSPARAAKSNRRQPCRIRSLTRIRRARPRPRGGPAPGVVRPGKPLHDGQAADRPARGSGRGLRRRGDGACAGGRRRRRLRLLGRDIRRGGRAPGVSGTDLRPMRADRASPHHGARGSQRESEGANHARPFSIMGASAQSHPATDRVAWVGRSGASSPTRVPGHAMRTYSGRPRSSMRFRTSAAMATSVACRPSVRDRSPSPTTRFHLEQFAG